MNEFVAKKIGEVLAFAKVGNDTFAKGKKALVSVLGEEAYEEALSENKIHEDNLTTLAEQNNVSEITLAKATKTGEKLTAMRDMYVGDQWDNPTELMEWSGFFEGAAIVHWKLVLGMAETLDHEALITLAEEAIEYHEELLEAAGEHLEEIGETKAE